MSKRKIVCPICAGLGTVEQFVPLRVGWKDHHVSLDEAYYQTITCRRCLGKGYIYA